MRSSARAAVSNSAHSESRSRWARRAAPPPTSTERRSRCGQDVPAQRSHRISSAGALASSRSEAPRSSWARARARGGLGAVDPVEETPLHDRPAQQVARGRGRSRLGRRELLLPLAEQPEQHPYVTGVEPAQRREQQPLGAARVDEVDALGVGVVEVQDRPQRVEQRSDGGVAGQRQVVAGHLDRDPGRGQRPPQRRDVGLAGPDEDRHPRPVDTVLEVGAPQQVGEVLGLGAVGVEGADLDPALAVGTLLGERVGERGDRVGVEAGVADPGRDPGRGERPAGARTGGCGAAPRPEPARPPGSGTPRGTRWMPRTSAPRKP